MRAFLSLVVFAPPAWGLLSILLVIVGASQAVTTVAAPLAAMCGALGMHRATTRGIRAGTRSFMQFWAAAAGWFGFLTLASGLLLIVVLWTKLGTGLTLPALAWGLGGIVYFAGCCAWLDRTRAVDPATTPIHVF